MGGGDPSVPADVAAAADTQRVLVKHATLALVERLVDVVGGESARNVLKPSTSSKLDRQEDEREGKDLEAAVVLHAARQREDGSRPD